MRKILLLGLLVVLIASCSKKTNVEITGAIKDAANTKVYLEQIDVSSRKTIDSTKINKNGEFKFELNIELPTFYSLRFSNNEQVTLIASPDEMLEVSGTLNDIKNNYWVDGSETPEFPNHPYNHANGFFEEVLSSSPTRNRVRRSTSGIRQSMGRGNKQTDQFHPRLYYQTRHLSGILLCPLSKDR